MLVNMRSAIVLIVWLAAGQAQQTGLTSNDCKAYTYREVPARRSKGQLNCSSSSHRDWSRVAIVAHEPYARSLLQDLPSRFLKRVEVLVHKICTVDEPAELIESLSGPNHFIVFSHIGEGNHTIPGEDKPVITSAEVFNRLVMMANADVVILAMKEDILHVNEEMVNAAARIFSSYPNLGMLGTSTGYTTGGWIPATPELQYVAAVEMGPIIVRRSAFLEVGMIDCLAEKCHQEAIHSLSLRMLLSGRRIGLMSFPNKDGIIAERVSKGAPHPKAKCDTTGVEGLLQKAVLKYWKLFRPQAFTPKYSMDVDGTSDAPVPLEPLTQCMPVLCANDIETAVLIQYFKRPEEISIMLRGLYRSLHRDPSVSLNQIEVILNDDSRTDYGVLRRRMALFPRSWLIFGADTHEIRAYNRMAKFSTAKYLVFAQDDDAPTSSDAVRWHEQFARLFAEFPKLQFLGSHRGRLDFGLLVDGRTNQISGPKFGTVSDTGRRINYRPISFYAPESGLPFMFAYKINAGPLFAHRLNFLHSGMFHTDLSCPGKPGIGFDFEFSVRTWSLGWQVGLFSANWTGHIGSSTESGTRKNQEAWHERRRMELRNNGMLYEMYSDYHHMEGTRLATESLGLLAKGEGAYKIHGDEHVRWTMTFLKSFQFSLYCNLLGYRDLVEQALGVCCKVCGLICSLLRVMMWSSSFVLPEQ
mmetsp:Transcript_34377/g.81473  ORF Transcript_34377/g.81473 Transcript_34377/m.81473 type:complete len:696 (-) Transcript_34377:631-2718(-)